MSMLETRSETTRRLLSSTVPDISKLPDDALLSRRQIAGLTGYTEQTVKNWTRQGKGPSVIYIEGRPRTTVRAYREWLAGSRRASA